MTLLHKHPKETWILRHIGMALRCYCLESHASDCYQQIGVSQAIPWGVQVVEA